MYYPYTSEDTQRIQDYARDLERSGVFEMARAAHRQIEQLFPNGVRAYLAAQGFRFQPQEEFSEARPLDAHAQELRARIDRRIHDRGSDQARSVVTRVALALYANPQEWISSKNIRSLGLSKDTVYSALRHQPEASRGGQGTRHPLEFRRVAVLEYVVAEWRPKRSSGSA